MTYGTIEIIKKPDGTTDALTFKEAQMRYGDFLEKGNRELVERFEPCLIHFKALNAIGKNGYELQKLLATKRCTPIDSFEKVNLTFGEVQEKYGFDLEFLPSYAKDVWKDILAKYNYLTGQKKNIDITTVDANNANETTETSDSKITFPNIYVITCTRVQIPGYTYNKSAIVDNPNMEFISTEIYEGKYYTSPREALKALNALYELDLDLQKRRPDFFHVMKLNTHNYVYSEVNKEFNGRDYYIYSIFHLSKEGTALDTLHIFNDIEDTMFRISGHEYSKKELYE